MPTMTFAQGDHVQQTLEEHSRLFERLQAQLSEHARILNSVNVQQFQLDQEVRQLEACCHQSCASLEQLARSSGESSQYFSDAEGRDKALEMSQGLGELQIRLRGLESCVSQLLAVQGIDSLQSKPQSQPETTSRECKAEEMEAAQLQPKDMSAAWKVLATPPPVALRPKDLEDSPINPPFSQVKLRDTGGLSGDSATLSSKQAADKGVAEDGATRDDEEETGMVSRKMPTQAMFLEDALTFKHKCYPLPASTYTTAFLDCVLSQDSSTYSEWFGRSYRAYFLHVFNLFIQTGCIILLGRLTLWHWNNIQGVECYALEPMPLLCCIFCFLCTIISEVEECEDMITILLSIIPTTEVTAPIAFRFDAEGYLHHDFSRGGMTKCRKVLLLVVVIVPRFLIAMAVLLIGSLYLAMSFSNADLLLNCVALHFILDIDSLIFTTLASNETVRLLQAMPVFESDHPPYCPAIDWKKIQSARRLFVGLLLTTIVFQVAPKCEQPITW
eukprot:TRINITY_DN4221_c0_g2_i1.p1 TRINITY_DN4221_c0_g2~~TRINITY_DN4221_c0_g2_i1.p1  ORF type:complete len:500 (+),score=67.70 TRINITY_DN4221_c0_g2_i1:97-1596(+)